MRGSLGDDLQICGWLARAAYRGLQRQHQFILLGAAKGTAEFIRDVFGRSGGPRLKVDQCCSIAVCACLRRR